jgi:hypothetical protein
MKGFSMGLDMRPIQFFLTDDYVCEVSIDFNDPKILECNCPRKFKFLPCKHIKFVQDMMEDNNGVLSFNVPEEVDDDDIYEAMEDAVSFRSFLIKNGKVEYLC